MIIKVAEKKTKLRKRLHIKFRQKKNNHWNIGRDAASATI